MRRESWILVTIVVLLAGCGGRPAAERGAPRGQPAVKRAPSPPPPPPPASESKSAQPKPAERKAATVGVGRKGHGYGTGPIATPAAAYFRTKERLAFIQVTQPMNVYKALKGHFPKTHQEFMEEIIRKNHLKLPELPAGKRYVYDAEKAAKMSQYDPNDPPLMVEWDAEDE